MIAPLSLKKPVLGLLLFCVAASGLLVACEDVTVSPVDVATLNVTPNQLTLTPGERRQLSVQILGNDGSPLTGRDVRWSSTNSGVVEVDGDGMVQGMVPGSATIEASSGGVDDATEVTVVPGVTLELTPGSLEFSAPEGGSSPPPQTVDVINVGSGTLGGLSASISYSAGDPDGWVDADLDGTSAPAELSVTVAPGGLPEGVYTASIEVRSPDAVNSPQDVVVTLAVGQPAPAISLGTGSVNFGATEGGADPEDRAVEITNSGAGTLSGLSSSVDYSDGEPTEWLSAVLEDDVAPTELLLSATTSDLEEGTYSATVTIASGVASNSPRTVNVTFNVSTGPPGAPSGLDATAVSASRIDLSWEDNSGNEAEFRIERQDGDSWEQIGTAGVDATSFSDTGLGESSTHTYRVRACNASGCSSYSNEAAATTIPAAPSDLQASPVSSSRIDLAWNDNSAGEDEFEVERRTSGGSFSTVATVAADQEVYSDTGLSGGTSYFYRVRACSESGCSTYSNQASGTTQGAAPSAPSDLEATSVSASRIDLSWQDNSGNEEEFRLERSSEGDSSWTQIATPAADVESYSDTGLAAATQYSYRVRAWNSNGFSSYSNQVTATTGDPPPVAPSNLTATTAGGGSRIEVEWDDNSTDETRFEIQRRPAGEERDVPDTLDADTESYTDSDVDEGTTYSYRVRACSPAGCSDWTAEDAATIPPAAPSALDAEAVSDDQIELSWNDNSSGESGFRIERSENGGTTWSQIATVGANADASATYSDDDGLSESTSYDYRVRACNAGGCSDFSNEAGATTRPAAPSDLIAEPESESRIDLSWTDNSDGENEIRIERRVSGGSFSQVATVAANQESYSDTGLSASTSYFYQVRACGASGCSGYSNDTSGTTAGPPPVAPSGLAAITVSSSEVTLEWSDDSDNEEEFRIERSSDGGSTWQQIETTPDDVETYADSGLDEGTTYTYKVRAWNSNGFSDYSNEASATTLPAAPSGFSAMADGSNAIDLGWTDNSDSEDTFEIDRSTDGGTNWTVDYASPAANATSFSDTGLNPDTKYTYRIRACNAEGCSSNAGPESATTADVPPAAPSGFEASPDGSDEIDLSWTDNSDNEDNFEIDRSTDGGATWTEVNHATPPADATSFSDTGLDPNTEYTYRIRACNTEGCSSNAGPESATTADVPPAAPSGFEASPDGSDEIDLSWTDNSDNEDNFEIDRSTDGGATWTEVNHATPPADATSFSDTGLDPNTEYTYRIRACNAEGCSADVGPESATTADVPPVAPSGFNATADGSDAIDLGWTDNSENETGFQIDRSTDGGATWTENHAEPIAGATTFSDTGLDPNTEYTYQIRACNAAGCSSNVGPESATTDDMPPAAPSGFTATANGSDAIDLGWSDNSGNETGFEIDRSTDGGATWTENHAEPAADATTFSDTGLNPDTEYTYQIRACNAAGCSSNVGPESATTDDVPPAAPSGFSALAIDSGQIDLSWTDNSNNEVNFEIDRSTDGGATWTENHAEPAADATTFSDTGLDPDTVYTYQIRACNAEGCSSNADPASATTTTP